jgi:fatty-acyl-CoA synthase
MNGIVSIPKGGVTPCSRRVMNLSHVLLQAARRFPDEAGFVWGEQIWTWSQLNARVDAMVVALRKAGISKGDRILVQCKNGNQMFETMFVCFRLGAVWVPTNYRQTPEEVAYLAQSSGASLMFCHADFRAHAEAAEKAAFSLMRTIFIGEDDEGSYDKTVDMFMGEAAPPASVNYDDPCWFFYTSGTTGRPKAAVLTHGQMGFVITNHLADLMPGASQKEASLVVAPLSHGAGIHQLVQTARAVKTVLPAAEKFNPADAWALIERWRVTNMFTVPTILKMLVEDAAVDRFDHSSLRHVIYAGAPMYREDQKYALKKLGACLVQYFGLGEVTGNITVLDPFHHALEDGPQARIGTCGVERTGMQISIQDDAGNEVALGASGEICVCGPAVFAGYYNNPEANEKAFRNGWFRTGDLGFQDAQGFLFITGRASDMYISGGSNVYPREIEEKVLQHPSIAEVAILGMPDPTWGEVGVAVLVLRPGTKLDVPDFLTWLGDKVARYKLPKQVVIWDAMPKSGYGKITKKLIRSELEARGDWKPAQAERVAS